MENYNNVMIYCRRYIGEDRCIWKEYLRRIKKFVKVVFYD